MPIFVRCADLRPGMRLAEPLMSGGRVLFSSGRELTDADVTSLQRRFPQANLRIGDPVLESLVDFEDDSRERAVATTVQQ